MQKIYVLNLNNIINNVGYAFPDVYSAGLKYIPV